MKKLLLFLPFVILFLSCSDDDDVDTGSVQGSVIEKIDGKIQPLSSVLVSIDGVGSVKTDNYGHYMFNDIEVGHYQLNFSKIGYTTMTGQVDVTAGKTAFYDVELESEKNSLIDISPASLNFSTDHTELSVTINNKSDQNVAWNVDLDINKSWISASPESGNLDANKLQTIVFSVNRDNLTEDKSVVLNINVAGRVFPLAVDCKKGNGYEPVPLNKQTLIVFFPHTGNLYSYLSNNIRDMEQAMLRTDNNPNVIVYMNYGTNRDKACIYKITRNGDVCEHDTLRKYTENPYLTPERMTSLFKEIKQLTNGTTEYKMVIGCHGMGWIYSDDYNNLIRAYPNMAYNYDSVENPITRWMGSSSAKIDINKFAEALYEASIHPKMMLFDVCYMSNIESLYELRNTADYIVASSIEIMGKGMPYLDIWNDIIAPTTKSSLNTLCKNVYDSYNRSSQPYIAISAIDCSRLENLALAVKDINSKYVFQEEKKYQLQILDGYEPPLFYDMGRYVELQCSDMNLYERYRQIESEVVSSHYYTAEYFTSLPEGHYGTHEIRYSSGITTSAPSVNKFATAGWNKTSWYKATH